MGVFQSLPAMSQRAMSIAGQRMHHERAAADVAMRAVDLLPKVLDARGVFAVDEFVERFDERLRHARIDRLDFTPTGDAVIRLNFHVHGGADPVVRGKRRMRMDDERSATSAAGFWSATASGIIDMIHPPNEVIVVAGSSRRLKGE